MINLVFTSQCLDRTWATKGVCSEGAGPCTSPDSVLITARPSSPLQALFFHLFSGEAVRTKEGPETCLLRVETAIVCPCVHSHISLLVASKAL